MKTKMNKIINVIALTLMFFAIPNELLSQIISSQTRFSLSRIQKRKENLNKIINLPQSTIKELLVQDSIESINGLPFRFGKNINLDIDLLKEATVVQKNDSIFYTFEIKCPGSFSINLIFDHFSLNDNSSLSIFNNDGNFIYGPVTSKFNPPNGVLWSDVIQGNHIIIEIRERIIENSSPNEIHISSLIYGYKNVFLTPNNYGDSYACNNDIACPVGDNWRVQANAVTMVLLDYATRWCSGSLINNTSYDFKGYLLTAFHCLDLNGNCSLSSGEKSDVNNWLFRFYYESPSCGGPDGINYITINGANFRAAYQQTDFALLELVSKPADATFAGWSKSSSAPNTGTAIHHPAGDVKKISFDYHTLTSNSSQLNWIGGCTSPANTHWVIGFDNGTAEGGSSGSPIFDENQKIVGQLHGGANGCAPVTKFFGRFDVSWIGGGTNDTRLSNWLDPTSTEAVTVNTVPSISGPSWLDCSSSFNYSIQGLTGATYSWTTSDNLQINGSSSNSTVNVSQIEYGGSGWVEVSIYITELDRTFVKLININVVSPTPAISSDFETICLNYEQNFSAGAPDFCTPPSSYTWYVNSVQVGSNSAYLTYTFDDMNWTSEQWYNVECYIVTDKGNIYVNKSGYLRDCGQPISVSISGDTENCINDWGTWSVDVSGGSGEYNLNWYINNSVEGGSQNPFDYFFDPFSWDYSQVVRIDHRVYDPITQTHWWADTYYTELDYCWLKGFDVNVSPNPASDYVNVEITKREIPVSVSSNGNNTLNKNRVENENESLDISLIDAYGKKIYNLKTSERRLTIPVSRYLPGAYHLKISSPKGAIDRTIIISH